jgi:hypothetical protein
MCGGICTKIGSLVPEIPLLSKHTTEAPHVHTGTEELIY